MIGGAFGLVPLVLLLGCTPDSGGAGTTARPTTATADPGSPMADTAAVHPLIELAVQETGERYRIGDDGRYLVTGSDGIEHETSPMSKIDRGTQRLTPRALARLRQAIATIGFSSLPDTVPGITTLPAGARPTGSGQFQARTFAFTVPGGGAPKSVVVRADARIVDSFGVLAPLWRALDEEALGGWQNE